MASNWKEQAKGLAADAGLLGLVWFGTTGSILAMWATMLVSTLVGALGIATIAILMSPAAVILHTRIAEGRKTKQSGITRVSLVIVAVLAMVASAGYWFATGAWGLYLVTQLYLYRWR
jgi:hypothetical protein